MEEQEKKNKKRFYKKWWFWLIIVVTIIIATGSGDTPTEKYPKDESIQVEVIDFSTMSIQDSKDWFDDNKINGKILEEYSTNIPKGQYIKQSIEANTIIYGGDKITITYSLGKEPTLGEKNALRKAESYSTTMNMSKKGIYNQLTSSIEGFTKSEAQYAIDNIEADWNENALKKAELYSTTMSMSKKAIYNQLTSSIEGFTKAEAQYAIDNLGK